MNFLNHINLNKNELRLAVIHPLAVAPSAPVEGQVYYSTVDKTIYQYNGTTWFPLDPTKLIGVIPISSLTVNPLDRGNHINTQLANTISNLDTTVKAYHINEFASAIGSVNMNSNTIINMADPVAPSDGATRNYVDLSVQAAKAGIDSKPSVRVLATSNIILTGTQTIDSVTLISGDRVLLSGQNTGSQNGSWIVSSGAWSRTDDVITSGSFWYIEEGSIHGKTSWIIQNTGSIVVGTTSLIIGQFLAAAVFTAGNGLQLIGNQFSIVAGSGLVVDSSNIRIDTTVVVSKYSLTIGDGSSTSFTVTHSMGSQDVNVYIRDVSTNLQVFADINANTTNTVVVSFSQPPATNAYRVTVHA